MKGPACGWVCFGLGGNVGSMAEVAQRFADATTALEQVLSCTLSRSRLYVAAPVGPVTDQPAYLNAAVGARLRGFHPPQLVTLALAVEARFGRDRGQETPQGPRTLDLDVLVAGEVVSADLEARVPHPRLWDRAFVLRPLADLLGGDAILTGRTRPLASRLGDAEIAAQTVRVHASDF